MIKRWMLCLLVLGMLVPAQAQVKIALSQANPNYENWVRTADPAVIPVNMYELGLEKALSVLDSCSALLLTGGEDVYPGYYGKLDQIGRCEPANGYRDTLEMALIQRALDLKMPVFGICRGEQILNVALGGTLFVDIPTDIDTLVQHRCPPDIPCLHAITIEPGSLLGRITGAGKTVVNSAHHQAAERIAPGMRAVAFSDNGVIEAIEREDPSKLPFIMGVQFHPERLSQNPDVSGTLAQYFVKQAREYHLSRKNIVRD